MLCWLQRNIGPNIFFRKFISILSFQSVPVWNILSAGYMYSCFTTILNYEVIKWTLEICLPPGVIWKLSTSFTSFLRLIPSLWNFNFLFRTLLCFLLLLLLLVTLSTLWWIYFTHGSCIFPVLIKSEDFICCPSGSILLSFHKMAVSSFPDSGRVFSQNFDCFNFV